MYLSELKLWKVMELPYFKHSAQKLEVRSLLLLLQILKWQLKMISITEIQNQFLFKFELIKITGRIILYFKKCLRHVFFSQKFRVFFKMWFVKVERCKQLKCFKVLMNCIIIIYCATIRIMSSLCSAPDKPQAPIVTESVNRTVTVQLKPVLPTLGPISAYQIIVLNEDNAAIGINKGTVLKSMSVAAAENLTQYITAELKPEVIQITHLLWLSFWDIYPGSPLARIL